MEILTILSQPITQIFGLVGIVIALQKYGVDVGGVIRAFLGIRDADTAHETDANLRNDFQKLLTQMQLLSEYFNHETTSELLEMKIMIKEHNDKHDQGLQLIRELKEYGVKCRKE